MSCRCIGVAGWLLPRSADGEGGGVNGCDDEDDDDVDDDDDRRALADDDANDVSWPSDAGIVICGGTAAPPPASGLGEAAASAAVSGNM